MRRGGEGGERDVDGRRLTGERQGEGEEEEQSSLAADSMRRVPPPAWGGESRE